MLVGIPEPVVAGRPTAGDQVLGRLQDLGRGHDGSFVGNGRAAAHAHDDLFGSQPGKSLVGASLEAGQQEVGHGHAEVRKGPCRLTPEVPAAREESRPHGRYRGYRPWAELLWRTIAID